MTQQASDNFDPQLDLKLERIIDVPRELAWQAWTRPEHVKQWFAPDPVKITDCKIDLRPGGQFYTVMQMPDGQEMPGNGCYLEVIKNERLVFTDALLPGYRPSEESFMTAIITFEPHKNGTKYTAVAKHKNTADRQTHEEMGFTMVGEQRLISSLLSSRHGEQRQKLVKSNKMQCQPAPFTIDAWKIGTLCFTVPSIVF